MVRFDVESVKYLSKEEWRVLTAIEMGMRNHELVPTELISRIAGMRTVRDIKAQIASLAKLKLLRHENQQYDGYKLTYLGYDYLALHAFACRSTVAAVGNKLGVGKEADIFAATDDDGNGLIIKFHRLGRTSFRNVKKTRDYLGGRQTGSWLYLSRLSAMKEYAFMKALHTEGFEVPKPYDWCRHAIVMQRLEGFPMCNVRVLEFPDQVMRKCLQIVVRLAEVGLIHGDLNEFNVMVTDSGAVSFYDFPQMVSTSHPNAEELFRRDIDGVLNFFRRKFRLEMDFDITLGDILKQKDLDRDVAASGWTREMEVELQAELERDDGDDGDDGDVRDEEDETAAAAEEEEEDRMLANERDSAEEDIVEAEVEVAAAAAAADHAIGIDGDDNSLAESDQGPWEKGAPNEEATLDGVSRSRQKKTATAAAISAEEQTKIRQRARAVVRRKLAALRRR